MDDPAVAALAASYNMHYWLQTRHSWSEEITAPPPHRPRRFISFEPWAGGFNNVRMSLEQAVALSVALNRTLVWPPVRRIYLRGRSKLEDYFSLQELQRGFAALGLDGPIPFEQFAEEFGSERAHALVVAGTLRDSTDPEVRVFTKATAKDATKGSSLFGIGDVVVCVPRCPSNGSAGRLGTRPPSVDTSLANLMTFRKAHQRLIDADQLETPRVLHFRKNLLGNFYTLVWSDDPAVGARIKRLVRDGVHYRAEIFERADRLVRWLGGAHNFSCMHIRRNDFQYKAMRNLPAGRILDNTQRIWRRGELVYVATDERVDPRPGFDPLTPATRRDLSFFAPITTVLRTAFLAHAYKGVLERDTPSYWLGCIEQLVCARARTFVGTYFSTFTSYIQRLRGYMGDVRHTGFLYTHMRYPEQYRRSTPRGGVGRMGPSWSQMPGSHPSWAREYAEGWEGTEAPIFR